ncbi:MAG: SDR family NAD(P)-dependent oxidoreductase, partial [Rothia aeria]
MATLITGASSGIGEEFAHHYAAEKHDLVLVARSEDKLNTLADTLRSQHGIQVTVIALDLSEPDAAQRLWEETNRARLEIDVLVNNAGFGTHGDVADDNPDRLEQEVRLNCLTLTGLTARYLPAMRERKNGTIINISSMGGKLTTPLGGWYHATKYAVEAIFDVKVSSVNTINRKGKTHRTRT